MHAIRPAENVGWLKAAYWFFRLPKPGGIFRFQPATNALFRPVSRVILNLFFRLRSAYRSFALASAALLPAGSNRNNDAPPTDDITTAEDRPDDNSETATRPEAAQMAGPR